MVNALVLAGSRNDGPLSQCSQVPYEAMIPIGNKPMIEYVVHALTGSRHIHHIAVVGPVEITKIIGNDDVKVISASDSLIDNLRAGVSMLPKSEKILLATCDIPLLTPQAIEDFLVKCGDQSEDVYYPVIPKEVMEKSNIKTKRTYVTFKEGQFTGGNLFLVNPAVVERSLEKGRQVVAARKSPVRLSKMMGIPFLVKFMLHRISLIEAEKKVSKILDIRGKVVVTKYPELGVDVDKPSDLEMVCKLLG